MNRRSIILAAASVIGVQAAFSQTGAFSSSSMKRSITIRVVPDDQALMSLDADDTVNESSPTVGDNGDAGPFAVPLPLEIGNQFGQEMTVDLTVSEPAEFDDSECDSTSDGFTCELTLDSGEHVEVDLTLEESLEGEETVTLDIDAVSTANGGISMNASRLITLEREEVEEEEEETFDPFDCHDVWDMGKDHCDHTYESSGDEDPDWDGETIDGNVCINAGGDVDPDMDDSTIEGFLRTEAGGNTDIDMDGATVGGALVVNSCGDVQFQMDESTVEGDVCIRSDEKVDVDLDDSIIKGDLKVDGDEVDEDIDNTTIEGDVDLSWDSGWDSVCE